LKQGRGYSQAGKICDSTVSQSSIQNHTVSSQQNTSEIIKHHPKRRHMTLDSLTKDKFPQQSQVHGKPTALINKQGIQSGSFINKSLRALSIEELIDLAEKYSGDKSKSSAVLQRILEKIEADAQNEYGRTKVYERMYNLLKTFSNLKIDHHQRGTLRIINHKDRSAIRQDSYTS